MTISKQARLRDGQLRYLVAEELKLAASLLYQAYHDDPLLMDLFQADKADYEKRLRAAIREELNAFWEAEQPMIGIFDEDSLVGVACLTRPGKSFGPGKYWHWRLKMLLTAGYVSTRQLIEKEALIQEAMTQQLANGAGEQHYHMLAFIAVHPRYQQNGWGHLLIGAAEQVLDDDSDSAGIAVYITQAKYLALFGQHNYRKVTDLQVGGVAGELLFYPHTETAGADDAIQFV
ncbi:GNAT family N-acetyltransferase [Pseudidiomarina salinarum]|uniref:GNAT family N-acetyltransferase n=1 Tax=Pseudidiomarina salinarum TaxID=435908 RepID=UPI00068FD1E5|nr:GNAT family N-acetyltransferase [Pseudidiomarina salinarum]RUO70533.1 GNAT family N-acetyltransferase [Pseudidiomarina salinarum]